MLAPILTEAGGFALSVAMTLALGRAAPSGDGLCISLDVRDAEATEIALALVEAARRQAVVAPADSCRLTIRLRDVHWRTALDHVLKPCGLAVDSDDGVLLIAPVDGGLKPRIPDRGSLV